MRRFKVAVDFDGTIVEHAFPEIGPEAKGAFHWMKRWRDEEQVKLMLWTMRSDGSEMDKDGKPYYREVLSQAAEYCKGKGIEFEHLNKNPEDYEWTSSPKLYANVYVDDAAFGCPLIKTKSGKMVVDWSKVGPAILKEAHEYNTCNKV